MRKFLALCLPVLLLVSCGSKTDKQLTLIFENAPEGNREKYLSDTVSYNAKQTYVKRVYCFTADTWLESFIPQGANDTMRIACGDDSHVELYHYYRNQGYHYTLLQAGDTVYVRYDEEDIPVYRSSTSDELTTLYNGDLLVFGRPPARFRDELYYNLFRSNSLESFVKKGRIRPDTEYPSVDSLLLVHDQNMLKFGRVIDSLAHTGVLDARYEEYYRYRLRKLALQPEILRHPWYKEDSIVGAYSFFNDDFCRRMSYWHTVADYTVPILRDGGKWDPTMIRLTENLNIYDYTELFDRLELFAHKIPPMTLNMMRYSNLMNIQNPRYQFAPEVQQEYFEKYRRYTAEFLVPSYIPVSDTMGFPFRFFVFLLEFMVCSGVFFCIYQLFLKDKVGFLTSRIYLLAALVFSAAIPLLALPVHLALLPDSALFWDSILGSALQLLFYAYVLGCMYMLGVFGWQLYRIYEMQQESWYIPGRDYRLYILTEAEVRPFAFMRKVFFSWSDWWDAGSKHDRDQLLAHETAHIRLWHGLDNLLVALGRILYWANPLLLAYGKELKRINEFAADRAVMRLYGRESYISALKATDSSYLKLQTVLVNSNEDELTERFVKIRSKAAPWYKNARFLIIIPLIILLMLVFSGEYLVNLGALPDNIYGIPR